MLNIKQLSRICRTSLLKTLTPSLNFSFTRDNIAATEHSRIDAYRHLATDDQQLSEIGIILKHFEYECYVSAYESLPLTIDDMKQLIGMNFETRRKYFGIVFRRKELKMNHELEKRETQIKLRQKWNSFHGERTGSFDNKGNLIYGLWHNSLFTRIQGPSMGMTANRLRNAAMFGQNVVFDLSSDDMPPLITRSFAFSLTNAYNYNRLNALEPFNVHFCNINYETKLWHFIGKFIDTECRKGHHYINLTTKSYLDVFPDVSNLVYITPDAKCPLEYDPKAVYIIGYHGFKGKIDFINAQRFGIKMRRFPIDENVVWGRGKRHMHLRSSLAILSDVKDGYHWTDAFHRNLSESCFKDEQQIQLEDQKRFNVLQKRLRIKEIMHKK